jgi:hypothetical protein
MPNPVLLAVKEEQAVKKTSMEPPMFEIEVTAKAGEPKPLWILDGQHRLRGLAASDRSDNPVPFVLLYSERPGNYVPEDFARLFAEVSTEQSPLNPLHNDWMQFAFRLGPYSHTSKNNSEAKDSMETVLRLCSDQRIGEDAEPNPFFDSIKLNPEKSGNAALYDGFAYDGTSLKDLIFKFYYQMPVSGTDRLDPRNLARELARSINALEIVMRTATNKSVFTGSSKYRKKTLQDAYIAGALAHILKYEEPSWEKLLRDLKFDEADWEFASWVLTPGGSEGNVSRKVATDTFVDAMGRGTLPDSRTDLVSFLKGTRSKLLVTAYNVNEQGRQLSASKIENFIFVNDEEMFNTEGRTHVRIKTVTTNIGKLNMSLQHSPYDETFFAPAFRKGRKLEKGRHTLLIQSEAYGGKTKSLELIIRNEAE